MVWFNAGRRESQKEGLEKRIIQQERNTFPRYGAIRSRKDAVMVVFARSHRARRIDISSLTLAAIKRQIISGNERHSTSCAASSYVIAIVGNHSLFRLLRMSR